MVLMIGMTCTPLTGVLKKKHDRSIRSFLVHFGFCLCLSIQLSHVIALFFNPFCHKVSFLSSKMVSNNFAPIQKRKRRKIKKTLCEGIVNMFVPLISARETKSHSQFYSTTSELNYETVI